VGSIPPGPTQFPRRCPGPQPTHAGGKKKTPFYFRKGPDTDVCGMKKKKRKRKEKKSRKRKDREGDSPGLTAVLSPIPVEFEPVH